MGEKTEDQRSVLTKITSQGEGVKALGWFVSPDPSDPKLPILLISTVLWTYTVV